MRNSPTLLLASFGLLIPALSAQTTELHVDWSQGASKKLDPRFKRVMLRQFQYPRGYRVPAVVQQSGQAFYDSLLAATAAGLAGQTLSPIDRQNNDRHWFWTYC